MGKSAEIVVFSACAIASSHFEAELDIAHRHADAGGRVTILTYGCRFSLDTAPGRRIVSHPALGVMV